MTGEPEAGVLLVDKPAGASSFDMVRSVRRQLGIKKVGHAGTLDPFATGLLIICIGRPATKIISTFMELEKEYVATLRLGWVSTTQDPEGEIEPRAGVSGFTRARVEEVLDAFRGVLLQTPPAYSALKHKGKPLYHYARRGITITKEPREIRIHQLEWLDPRERFDDTEASLRLRVRCSKGTYIRTLAADIGEALGCGAYLTALRRTRCGIFSVENSISGTALGPEAAARSLHESILSVEAVRKMLQ